MDSSSSIIRFLAEVPHFSAMDPGRLSNSTVLPRSRCWPRGRLPRWRAAQSMNFASSYQAGSQSTEKDRRPKSSDKGRRWPRTSFFAQRPATASLIALRDTVLVTLSWADLAAAFRSYPDLIETCFATFSRNGATVPPPLSKPTRLVLCAAGAKGRLDAAVKDAFVSALEGLAEVEIPAPGKLRLTCPRRA